MHSRFQIKPLVFFHLPNILKLLRKCLHIEGRECPGFAGRVNPLYGSAEAKVKGSQALRRMKYHGEQTAGYFRCAGVFLLALFLSLFNAQAQTDCGAGSTLDTTPPKEITVDDLIHKFIANETRVQTARSHYQYTQDVLVQTLDGAKVDGQFHQVTNVSYDNKGKRVDQVTFSEQPTLRGIQMSSEDFDDIREFMPWILSSEQVAQYNLTYSGQQHVDDLDTYVFQVAPKKEEKNKRYFDGRVWVDSRDLQVVKLCGKSVPDAVRKKKNAPVDVRPTFVSYRQIIDGNWFPVYARVDATLEFGTASVHVREIVKYTGYKRTDASQAASKP